VASNPRIDDLRGRLEKDPGSRLFAQLAEELRKDGELEEAIRVSRAGLQRHPAYPSARMTLGRALLDTGDLAAARIEFETVLKGAPDNILASRFLGECLEGLGDLAGARDRFKATLALAPGDKQVTAHLQELEAKLKKASGPSAPTTAAGASRAAPPESPAAAIPVAQVDEPMELERSVEARPPSSRPAPTPSASPEATVVMSSTPTVVMPPAPPAPAPAAKEKGAPEPPPIPLVAAEEDFELERAFEAPTVSMSPQAPPETRGSAAPPTPPAPAYEPPAAPSSEFEFDLAPDAGGAVPVPEPWRPEPEAAPPTLPREPEPEPQMEPPIPPPPPAVAAPVALPPIPPPAAAAPEPERVVQAAPPLPPPVFAPAPPPPTAPRAEAPSPVPPREAPRAPAAEADELTSSTLAELYFNQGFTDKAIEVYRQLLQREPGNERARTRLGELEALERRIKDEESRAAPAPGDGAADPAAARRQAIERTIARLEGLLTALRKE
jgi:tetratricopeptide (TPR) repeat protein